MRLKQFQCFVLFQFYFTMCDGLYVIFVNV